MQRLLQSNVAVIGVDLLGQGELLADGQPLHETRRVDNPREAAAYTLGYNPSLFAQRVHDVLTLVAFVSHHELSPSEVWLLGLDHAGPWAAAAMAQADGEVDRAAICTGGFRFIDVPRIRDENLLPGGAKYHDLPGMLALAAPHKMCVADEDEVGLSVTIAAYQAANAPENLKLLTADPSAQTPRRSTGYWPIETRRHPSAGRVARTRPVRQPSTGRNRTDTSPVSPRSGAARNYRMGNSDSREGASIGISSTGCSNRLSTELGPQRPLIHVDTPKRGRIHTCNAINKSKKAATATISILDAPEFMTVLCDKPRPTTSAVARPCGGEFYRRAAAMQRDTPILSHYCGSSWEGNRPGTAAGTFPHGSSIG